ncbi:MAG: AraC family transcriptional regulator [Clostridium perfringens]|nr:AraC family transcriptional regulator [Clostridium perfringens]
MDDFFYQVKRENKNLFYKLYVHKISSFQFNWHKEIQINIILRGKAEICIEGRKYLLSEDDIIIINSNSGHATLAKEPNTTVMVLQLDPIYFKEYFKEYENLRFEEFVSISEKENEKCNTIKYLLALLISEFKDKSKENQIGCDSILSVIVLNILKGFSNSIEKTGKVKKSKNQIKTISKILKYIQDMHKEKISLDKIAGMLGYNSNYFSQFFKVNIGINYYEYLTRVRIREATFELIKTNRSISDIALEHGFSDAKSFNKYFKESFGRTPNQYRGEILENDLTNEFSLDRILVSEDDEYVIYKLKEYKGLIKENIFALNKESFHNEDLIKREISIKRYEDKVRELEDKIKELNEKITLIKGILN